MTDAAPERLQSLRTKATPSDRPKATPRPVLLVVLAWSRPTYALRRAAALARTLAVDLHLLRVLPGPETGFALFRRRNIYEAMARLERESRAVDDLRNWCAESDLLDAPPPGKLHVCAGDLEQHSIRLASELNPQLIVLSALGAAKQPVTSLCRKSATPVLVVREVAAKATIVVGADLEDDRLPEFAADIAGALGAPVVFVHNVGLAAAKSRGNARVRLEVPGPWGTIVVSNVGSAAQAVLEEARLRQADLVVVGTRTRPRRRRWLRRQTAEKVVQAADLSVLVAPG